MKKMKDWYDDVRARLSDGVRLHYDIAMGLITSVLIAIVELVSYLLVDEQVVKNINYYLYASIVMMLYFFFFMYAYKSINQKKTIGFKFIIETYPFAIAALGIMISYIYQGFSNQIDSFMIAVIVGALIKIYPRNLRLFYFSLTLIAFNVMNFSVHQGTPVFYSSLRYSMMISIVGFVYSFVYYHIYQSQVIQIERLNQRTLEKEESLTILQRTYRDLESSHKITEAMLRITTEVLKNDRLNDVLDLVLKEATHLVPKSQAGTILIFNGEEMEFRASFGYDIKSLQKITLKVEDLFQSQLPDKYEPTIVKNLEVFDEKHVDQEKVIELRAQQALFAKSVLTCAFKFNGEFFGTINLDNFDSEDIYDDGDKYLIKHLAKEIEIVISIHKLYEKALMPSKYDELTKAFSRRYYKELLVSEIDQAHNENKTLNICMLDINNLKEINDQFGHEIGDQYLLFFAEGVRKTGLSELIFSRIGGDEFVLVFYDQDLEQTNTQILKLREYFERNAFVFNGHSSTIQFGCGVATYPKDGTNLEELISLSDKRMYEDKKKIKK